jgi:uncharacterized pyridoxamine 5'-phosphate oxidase family protein
MATPRAGRPHAPGYGFPSDPDGALPWAWAQERLRDCRNYFVASVRPDGRPHSMPVWGLWLDDDVFYFATAITSVKSKNLLANLRATVTVERDHDAVIVEGECDIVETSAVPGLVEAYRAKYAYESFDEDKMWRMRPTVAFAFIEDDSFSSTATRWTFPS